MKNAYMIMAHTNFKQLGLLISLLDNCDNELFIHVDARAKGLDAAKLKDCASQSPVHFIRRRKVTWGGYSQIACELDLIEAAANTSHDYYHLLSGQDLPIKSNHEIAEYLYQHDGTEFVGIKECGRDGNLSEGVIDRVRYYHPLQDVVGRHDHKLEVVGTGIQRTLHVDRLHGNSAKIAKGCNWFSITENFARYVLLQMDYIRQTFSSSLCADELFLQTVFANSPFGSEAKSVLDSNFAALRLIDWKRGSPWIFRADDLAMIQQSPCLFARKFDSRIDRDAIWSVARMVKE